MIAREDIICAKLLLVDKSNDLFSPFMEFKFTPNLVYNNDSKEDIKPVVEDYYEVGSGFFHAYLLKEAADETAEKIIRKYKVSLILKGFKAVTVRKAIIPAGTPYYIGQDGDICAKSIKIE
jgi:hypothetical protein